MYLIFYVSGLAHLHAAERVANSFVPGWRALFIVGAVLVTGAVGIPLRFYLLSAVAFDFRKLRSEEHTSELQSHLNLVCRLLLEKKKTKNILQQRDKHH